MEVEKIEIDVLSLNKITLINHPPGNLRAPDGCYVSNPINLLQVVVTPRGPPGCAGHRASSWEMGTAPALGLGKPACKQPCCRGKGTGSQGIQRKPLAKFFMTFSFIYNRDVVFPGEE